MNKAINTYFLPIITVLLISGCSFNHMARQCEHHISWWIRWKCSYISTSGTGDTVSFWDPGNASGKPLVKINLEQQKARFYMGSTLVGVSRISSGREDLNASRKLQNTSKNADHISIYMESGRRPMADQ